jgi:putative superfamily III holin-X
MNAPHLTRSIPEVFSDLIAQLTALLRKEGQLARTEISEKISGVAAGLALAMVGAVLAMPALVILLEAIVAALMRTGMSMFVAALIVGGVALAIGIILLVMGLGRLKATNLVPEKTLHQLQRDAQVVKQEASDDHDLNRAA